MVIKMRLPNFTLGFMAAVMVCCTGCSGIEKDVNHFEVKKDGSIVNYIVEDFDQSYYNLEELEALIEEEVNDYNQKLGYRAVKASKVKLSEDGVVSLKMEYASVDDYNSFNDRNMFVGTVREASAAGFQFTTAMVDVEDETNTISNQEISSLSDMHILITEEAGVVETFGKVLYISSDGHKTGMKEVSIADHMEGLCYILFQ